ncbi:MAG: hypothetical protein ACKO5Y_00845 [Bacteroidota bacterium]
MPTHSNDTIISLNKSDFELVNEFLKMNSISKSKYGSSSDQIVSLEMQRDILINQIDMLKSEIQILEDKNDQLITDKIGMEMMFETAHGLHLYEENVKRLWKMTSICGIPISFGVGFLINRNKN